MHEWYLVWFILVRRIFESKMWHIKNLKNKQTKNIFLSNVSFNRLRALSVAAIVGHLQNYKQGPISFCVSSVTSPHMCVTHTRRKTSLTQQECEITMFRDQQWRGSSWATGSQKTWDTSGKATTPPNSWSLSGTLPWGQQYKTHLKLKVLLMQDVLSGNYRQDEKNYMTRNDVAPRERYFEW